MGKFLDKAGLQTVWGLIKNGFVAKSSVSEKSTTLTWNTETEIANIDGKSIKVKIPAAPTFSNTARLQVSDTTNKRINTKESTGNYIQFTGGTNKFTVGDGTNSFDVSVTPSISLAHTITVKSGVKKDGTTEISATSSSAANPTVSLGDSGVSAGIYGPSGDVSGSNGNTIKVPQIRVNAKGIVTEISEKTFTAVNSTYTVNNGSFTIKTKVGSNAAVNVGSTSANASGNSDVTFIQGTNVTLTTDTTNRTITISSTDTNTHNSHGHTFTTTAPTSVGTTLGWGGTFDVVTALGNASATSGNLSSTYTTYRFQLPGNPNTDSKVTQTATTSSNTSWRPLILGGGNNYSDATVFAPVNVTDGVLSAHLAKFAPSQGIMALVGLKKLGTDGKEVAGSNTTVWNTNGGTTSLSSYLTSQDHYKTSPTAGSYGMKDATTGNNGTKIQIPYITVDGNGHVTSISNKEYTAVDHTYTVGSANLSLQVNGASKTTFSANATSAASFNIANGTSTSGNGTFLAGGVAVSIYGLAGAAYKALDADSMTASSTNVPTSKAVAAYVSAALTSVLTYKGTIGSSGATVTALPASHKVGDTYVVSVAGTYAGKACEVGDYIICKTAGTSANDSHWDVVNGENQVENKSASLAGAGSSATIATVDGTNLTITTPSTWTGVAKTGTVTSVATGAGLTGGTITGSGTIKVKLKDETANSADSSKSTSTNGGLYSVEVDKSGNLAVRVPWTDHTYTVNNGTLNLQANGTTKTTFTANQSGNSTFNIATGSGNGTISVGGVDVSVKGLGSAAYTNSGDYATSGHNHDGRYLRNYHKSSDITSTEVVADSDYIHNVGDSGGASTTMTKPAGMDNAWGILHMHLHTGNYAMQLGFGGTTGHMYFRNAYNTATFGAWVTLLDSNNSSVALSGSTLTVKINGTSHSLTNTWRGIQDNLTSSTNTTESLSAKQGYLLANGSARDNTKLPLSGGTMTGLLTTTSGSSHAGVKVGNTYINAINGDLIFQNNGTIRFGGDSWDYNVWAGLKYVHSSKVIYLGLADGSAFTANSAQSGGKVYTPGVSEIYIGNGTYKVWHAGNDGSGSGLDADTLDGNHASAFALSGHTHTTSIATSSGTNQITLAYGTKYAITAGGTSYVFTMPSSDNTWRPIGTGANDAAAGNHTHDGRYLRWNGNGANVTAMTWGTLTEANGYTILSHASSSDGGDWGMVNKGGQIFMQLDGYYYQNEGRYRVLDTSDSSSFASAGHTHSYLPLSGGTETGSITFSQTSSTRTNGIIGTYDPNAAAAIWSMGASYQIATDGKSLGSLYGAAYVYYGSGYTYGAGKSGGHSFVWAQNGNPTAALGNNVWTSGGFIKNGSSDSYVLLGGGGHKAVSDFATSGHTHTTSIATSSATNQITLAFGTKYVITAGGTSYVFTMPGNPNTNTWRPIQVGGVDKLTDSSTKINFTNSGSASVSYSGGTITIGCSAAANATADSALTAAEVEALLV